MGPIEQWKSAACFVVSLVSVSTTVVPLRLTLNLSLPLSLKFVLSLSLSKQWYIFSLPLWLSYFLQVSSHRPSFRKPKTRNQKIQSDSSTTNPALNPAERNKSPQLLSVNPSRPVGKPSGSARMSIKGVVLPRILAGFWALLAGVSENLAGFERNTDYRDMAGSNEVNVNESKVVLLSPYFS